MLSTYQKQIEWHFTTEGGKTEKPDLQYSHLKIHACLTAFLLCIMFLNYDLLWAIIRENYVSAVLCLGFHHYITAGGNRHPHKMTNEHIVTKCMIPLILGNSGSKKTSPICVFVVPVT